jgi:hypothetical protein
MREAVPSYLSDVKALKEYHKIIEIIRSAVGTHLCGQKPMQIVMAKDILCTLASSSSSSSCRGVVGALGMDRRTIRRGIGRRIQLDGLNQPFWINYRRSGRSDSISVATKNLVQEWWTTETQISPNRKDICRRKSGTGIKGDYEEHPIHYLQTSQV